MVERPTRPPMDRTGPFRDLGGMWRAVGGSLYGRQDEESAQRSDSESDGKPRAADANGTTNFVEEGIKTAYSVLESSLKQGERIAQRISRLYAVPQWAPSSTAGDFQARWISTVGELTASWMELISLTTNAAATFSGFGDQENRNGGGGHAKDPGGREVISEVVAAKPARVRIRIDSGVSADNLQSTGAILQGSTPGLGAPESAGSTVIGVAFEPTDSGEVLARVCVGEKHQSGRYTGTVVNTNNGDIVGTVDIEVG